MSYPAFRSMSNEWSQVRTSHHKNHIVKQKIGDFIPKESERRDARNCNKIATNGDQNQVRSDPNTNCSNSKSSQRRGITNSEGLYGPGIVQLDEEMKRFYKDILPQPSEERTRELVVHEISQVITKRWPGAKVEVFGSFNTGLYLPTSDIDLVVMSRWHTPPLYDLRDALNERAICEDIKVINSAIVPIIKLVHAATHIKVDIGFNLPHVHSSARLIKNYVHTFPSLPCLVMVLKQFLYQRDLNEVYTGGLSSYSLCLMLVSFLMTHPRAECRSIDSNCGALLIEFLYRYGCNFDYNTLAISIKDGGYVKRVGTVGKSNTLTIYDPFSDSNDVARGSFNFMQVRQAFLWAFQSLYFRLCLPHLWPDWGVLSAVLVGTLNERRTPQSLVDDNSPHESCSPCTTNSSSSSSSAAGDDSCGDSPPERKPRSAVYCWNSDNLAPACTDSNIILNRTGIIPICAQENYTKSANERLLTSVDTTCRSSSNSLFVDTTLVSQPSHFTTSNNIGNQSSSSCLRLGTSECLPQSLLCPPQSCTTQSHPQLLGLSCLSSQSSCPQPLLVVAAQNAQAILSTLPAVTAERTVPVQNGLPALQLHSFEACASAVSEDNYISQCTSIGNPISSGALSSVPRSSSNSIDMKMICSHIGNLNLDSRQSLSNCEHYRPFSRLTHRRGYRNSW